MGSVESQHHFDEDDSIFTNREDDIDEAKGSEDEYVVQQNASDGRLICHSGGIAESVIK